MIWRSELRALADDREVREMEEALSDAAGRAGAASAAWPKAAAVPPDASRPPGNAPSLEQRLAELERSLAALAAAAA